MFKFLRLLARVWLSPAVCRCSRCERRRFRLATELVRIVTR